MDVVGKRRCSCEKYLSKVILLEVSWAVLFMSISAVHCEEWKALSEELSALHSSTLGVPGPSSQAAHLGLWGSVQRNGVKKIAVQVWPTLERQEMGWTQLSTWSRKWIFWAGAAEVKTSTTSGRFPLCISWVVGLVFSLPASIQVIAKFKPLRMKVCNPCVILKNCLKIRL